MGSTPEEIDRLWAATGWCDAWRSLAASEQPVREVELDGFWVYQHAVTIEQYGRFLAATGHPEPDMGLMRALERRPDVPMVFLNWDDAAAYCEWAGASLPTEAQWEYAARGPERRQFPWGNAWDPALCNCADAHAGRPLRDASAYHAWWGTVTQTAEFVVDCLAPVDAFPTGVSWCGALDMAGNVWEWCADWYDPALYSRPAGRNPVAEARLSNDRVLRGGSWMFDAVRCRGANRGYYNPGERMDFFGVRPVAGGEPL